MKNKLLYGLICSLLFNIVLIVGTYKTALEFKDQAKTVMSLETTNFNINKEIDKLYLQYEEEKETVKTLKEEITVKDHKIKELNDQVKKLKSQWTSWGNYTVSPKEFDLLCRLVEGESGIEPYNGKVAVAQVVLNRVKDKRFPNTITGVIYQKNQFEVVPKGMLWDRTPSQETISAVKDALRGKNVVGNSISFWADYLRSSHSLWDLPIKYRIGGHVFTDLY